MKRAHGTNKSKKTMKLLGGGKINTKGNGGGEVLIYSIGPILDFA